MQDSFLLHSQKYTLKNWILQQLKNISGYTSSQMLIKKGGGGGRGTAFTYIFP